MRQKWISNLMLLLLLSVFFVTVGTHMLLVESGSIWPKYNAQTSDRFRRQRMEKKVLPVLYEAAVKNRGVDAAKLAGVYFLETKYGARKWDETRKGALTLETLSKKAGKWKSYTQWNAYAKNMLAIWSDVRYFPIPLSSVREDYQVYFTDSWMNERTFGGKRGHEGTDLMTAQDIPGRYPVISMTDGIVIHKGWLAKGGRRIGILAPNGGYFYYAHLDSYANLKEGSRIRAGTLLGFAGNSGYGPEGTTGKFATHLHIGIYLNPGKDEISVNPYWILKYLEQNKLTYTYE